MKFLDKLRGVKTSAEYEVALGEVNASIVASSERLATLKHALRSAPFNRSEDDIKDMRQRVRDLEDEIEFSKGVAVETEERRKLTAAAERRAEVDRIIEAAQPDLRKQAEMCAGYVQTLDKMARSFVELERVQRRLFEVNNVLVSLGYPDDQLRFHRLQVGAAVNELNSVMIAITAHANPDLGRYLRGEG